MECLQCKSQLDEARLDEQGLVECEECGSRFVSEESQALSFVDEIPDTEYLGG